MKGGRPGGRGGGAPGGSGGGGSRGSDGGENGSKRSAGAVVGSEGASESGEGEVLSSKIWSSSTLSKSKSRPIRSFATSIGSASSVSVSLSESQAGRTYDELLR